MPACEVLQFTHESATCNVTLWGDGSASISDVESCVKRKGHASGLMEKVIEFTDNRGLLLKTAAEPYGEEPRIPIEKLTEFYKKYGFTILGDDPEYVYMERSIRIL